VGDRPGALAALLTRVGELGANVIDVAHTRIVATVPMGEVDVALSLEMRGPEHCRELVAALRSAGHQVTVTGVPDDDPRLRG
jgi:threonine dehydratase